MLKKMICIVIGIAMLLFVGCSEGKANWVGRMNDESLINTSDPDIELEGYIDSQGKETLPWTDKETFIDFSKQLHWEIAYQHMQSIGKPVGEISDNYLNWKFTDGYEGGAIFEDPESELEYAFVMMDDIYYYITGRKLSSDEVCYGVLGKVQSFFPDAKWPNNISETKDYLESYLGMKFDLPEDGGGNADYGGYFIDLRKNNCSIAIWSDNGIIRPESGMEILGWDVVLE